MLPRRLRNHLLFPMILPSRLRTHLLLLAILPSRFRIHLLMMTILRHQFQTSLFRPAVQVKRSCPAVRTMLPYQADPRQNSHYKYFLSAPGRRWEIPVRTCFLCQKPDRKFQSTFFQKICRTGFPLKPYLFRHRHSLCYHHYCYYFFPGKICLFLPWGSAHPVPCQVPRVFFLPCIPLFIYLFIFHFMFLILRAFPSRVSYMPLHRRI